MLHVLVLTTSRGPDHPLGSIWSLCQLGQQWEDYVLGHFKVEPQRQRRSSNRWRHFLRRPFQKRGRFHGHEPGIWYLERPFCGRTRSTPAYLQNWGHKWAGVGSHRDSLQPRTDVCDYDSHTRCDLLERCIRYVQWHLPKKFSHSCGNVTLHVGNCSFDVFHVSYVVCNVYSSIPWNFSAQVRNNAKWTSRPSSHRGSIFHRLFWMIGCEKLFWAERKCFFWRVYSSRSSEVFECLLFFVLILNVYIYGNHYGICVYVNVFTWTYSRGDTCIVKTIASLELLANHRPDCHVCNEQRRSYFSVQLPQWD